MPCSTGADALGDPAPSIGVRAALLLIRAYKVALSPLFAGSCRYVPGCADYTAEAIARHGVMRGGWLGARRLARCHPFGGHGHDPVPTEWTRERASSPNPQTPGPKPHSHVS